MYLCRPSTTKDRDCTVLRPVWSESDTCEECNRKFNMIRRRHHCRNCGMTCCSSCAPSKKKVNIPKLGYTGPIRVCGACHELCVTADEVHAAIVSNGFLTVEQALDKKFDPNFSTTLVTPLIQAAGKGFTKIMALLVERGADPTHAIPRVDNPVFVTCDTCEKKSKHEYNPLHHYRCPHCDETNEHLSTTHTQAGQTALHQAAAREKVAAVEYLLELGVNVNARTVLGNTALCMAAACGSSSAMQTLIEGKAEVNVRNAENDTPLHAAILSQAPKAVSVLLEAGANIFLKNNDDVSPLALSDELNSTAICTLIAMHKRKLDAIANGESATDDDAELDQKERVKRDFQAAGDVVDEDAESGASGDDRSI